MDHWGCVRIIFMRCYTDGCLWVLTILVGDRESLAGVGLIVSHTGAAVWLKALYESYRVIGGSVVIVISIGDFFTEVVHISAFIIIPTMLHLPVRLT